MEKGDPRLFNGNGTGWSLVCTFPTCLFLVLVAALSLVVGCASRSKSQQENSFFTSGSKEADQRASQRMAKAEELAGTGGAGGVKGSKKSGSESGGPAEGVALHASWW